jgi:hypothetical protein
MQRAQAAFVPTYRVLSRLGFVMPRSDDDWHISGRALKHAALINPMVFPASLVLQPRLLHVENSHETAPPHCGRG